MTRFMLVVTYILTNNNIQLLNFNFPSIRKKKLIKKLFQVPNAIGFVLASAQLILYSIYKYKSKMLEKSADVMKEESPTQRVKGVTVMQANDEEANL